MKSHYASPRCGPCLPRKINRLAHYALSAAASGKMRQITAEHLQCAA